MWFLYLILGLILLWLALTLTIVTKLFFGSLGRVKKKKKGIDTSMLVSSLEPYKEEIKAGKEWYRAQNIREVTITANDGITLYADVFEAENAIGTLILMHGYRSSAINDFTLVFPFYHNLY